jgi:hypothetical protein
VTEQEWQACRDPFEMLEHLRGGGVSDRRLRLFACGCVRRVWTWLTDERSRAALEAAERYADGLATDDELSAAREAAAAAGLEEFRRSFGDVHRDEIDQTLPPEVAEAVTRPSAGDAAEETVVDLRHVVAEMRELAALAEEADEAWAKALSAEASGAGSVEQAALLRDVIANPFRPSPAIDPAWLAWNGGTLKTLASAIYEQQRFQDLPILADALEDAGCAEASLLDHLRGPGPHVRGCWAVDLLLGKE